MHGPQPKPLQVIAAALLLIQLPVHAVAPSIPPPSPNSPALLAPQVPDRLKLPRVVPGEVLVRFKEPGAALRQATAARSPSLDLLFQKLRIREVTPVFRISGDSASGPLSQVYRVELGKGIDPEAAAAELSRDPQVVYAEPNRLSAVAALPNDEFLDPEGDGSFRKGTWGQPYADLWGLERIGWGQVWQRQAALWPDPARRGGGGVAVAVIDTGLDVDHPDLAANVWRDAEGHPGYDVVDVSPEVLALLAANGLQTIPGEDYADPDADPDDRNGHGTHVAGTIAAVANDQHGIAGVAWGARVMPVRAGFALVDQNGDQNSLLEEDDIAAAIQWAADHGAQVINMSFGRYGEISQTVNLAVEHAHSLGVVLVAAAGNESDDASLYTPASHPFVVSVGASYTNGRRIWFSNWGLGVDLSAPGSDIVSVRGEGTMLGGYGGGLFDDEHIRASGTSMAAPHVAGAVALVRSAFPALGPDAAVARVLGTADPTGEFIARQGRRWSLGSGRLNVLRALTAPERPAFVVRWWEVVADDDGDRVPEPGETVRLQIGLQNVWQAGRAVSVRLAAGGPEASVAGTLPARFWPAGQIRTITATLRLARQIPWGKTWDLRIELRGQGLQQDVRLPLAVRGPAPRAGWPVEGRELGDGVVTSPVLADVAGDQDLEILATTLLADVQLLEPGGSALPGWPLAFEESSEQSSPLVEDLDQDGDLEIVFVFGRQVHVVDAQGRERRGWPRETSAPILSSVAAGDVDGDGRSEIIAMSLDARLWVFDAAGRNLHGWPRKLGNLSNTSPVLADLDGKPGLEIVTGTADGLLGALRFDGTPPPGSWPANLFYLGPSSPVAVDLDGDGRVELVAANVAGLLYRIDRRGRVRQLGKLPGHWSFSSPAAGDLDGDGRPEIVVGSGYFDRTGFLSVLDAEGRMLPGWPLATAEDVSASPALIDLDGDRRLEVVVPDQSGLLHAWRADGTEMGGWPFDLDGFALSSPVVADLDRDGTWEIVCGRLTLGFIIRQDPMLHVLEFGRTGGSAAWPMFKGNARRTGRATGRNQE